MQDLLFQTGSKIIEYLERSRSIMLESRPLFLNSFGEDYPLLHSAIKSSSEKLIDESKTMLEFFSENEIVKKKERSITLDKYYGAVDLGDFYELQRIKGDYLSEAILEGKHLLNLVFPLKNAEELVGSCLESVLDDISNEQSIYPIFSVVLNNTDDNTLYETMRFFDSHEMLSYNIIEYKSNTVSSLPVALNVSANKFRSLSLNMRIPPNLCFFGYSDDDSRPIHTSEGMSNIGTNIRLLLRDDKLKLISGQSVDERKGISYFHDFASVSNRLNITLNQGPKPYCHGGAGFATLRLSDYPCNGLPLDGLGGINLNTEMINQSDIDYLKNLDTSSWVTRTNPKTPFFHPTRDNIFDWSCTYLGYQKAWRKAFSRLSPDAGELYLNIKHQSKSKMLDSIIASYKCGECSMEDMAGYLLIKWFYLPTLRTQTEVSQNDLKIFTNRYHNNL